MSSSAEGFALLFIDVKLMDGEKNSFSCCHLVANFVSFLLSVT